jgi:carboxymethylenebutenolidase
MIDRNLELVTPAGTMSTFVTHPDEGGPFPVVLFFMDAPGKREELHDMARRLGTAGYYVMLPNLYYRDVADFDYLGHPDPVAARARMFELMGRLTDEMVVDDAAALLAHADADPAASSGAAGCVGYCMSGPFVMAVAGSYPERIAAGASFHGVRLWGAGAPIALLDRARGELYFGCAEHDDYAPTVMVEGLREHLTTTGANARVEWYPGAEHGFVFPLRAAYDKASAERHWERLLALYARNLGGVRAGGGRPVS